MTYRKSEAIARWRGESVVGASEGWARLFAAGACARLAHQLLCAISELATAAPETEARLGVAAPEKHAAPLGTVGTVSVLCPHDTLHSFDCRVCSQPARRDRIDDAKLGSKLSPRRSDSRQRLGKATLRRRWSSLSKRLRHQNHQPFATLPPLR
ncbi:hypothetical protein SNOG_16029 [Parastagonospora nodorum SN15]|uniref:Uncharacterized protein n=1 Tax=Phaeosphaeria nodorum (strain SN15 / ATCC MYA-4574 / FGSC 10173) TaxID=321614 RepID=Q0TWW0_PHANO|nr:hypothetical protein SNOG_16029 [Parastagonospora nodorum SN15]EAT76608.2 hypothetical protein SNOG_16029 [Parastagonospora nodorum SN15]